jgi:nucleoid-associated protein EbfC
MDMKRMMMEAQKMQKELLKIQDDLAKTVYDGESSMVKVKVNGNNEVLSVMFDLDEEFAKDDVEILEDMVVVAINDAIGKVKADKEKKLGKYGSGLSGLM